MKDILVSIDSDLPSSIALRYCRRLADVLQARVQAIHAKEPGADAPAIGAGWAQNAWRDDLLAQARQEMTQVLRDDTIQGPALLQPILEVGDREAEIMAELRRRPYALAAVGLPLPLTPESLHRLFRLEVAHITTCPVLFCLTMAPPRKVLFCLGEAKADSGRMDRFAVLMEGADIELDLAMGPADGQAAGAPMPAEERLGHAARLFESRGFVIGRTMVMPSSVDDAARVIDEYGMVAPPIRRSTPKDGAWPAILSHASTSMLIC